jgi:hypothetical protein
VLAAAVTGTTLLALGATGPAWGVYGFLFDHAPGWNALRTPGRLVVWVTLGLALLAAGGVARVGELLRAALAARAGANVADDLSGPPDAGRRVARAAPWLVAALPLALVVYEGLGDVPQWPIAPPPVEARTLTAPVLYLPSDPIGDYTVMLWSTQGWPVIANGSSGFDPPYQAELRQQVATFPDAASVAALQERGVRSVVLVPSRAAGTPWAGAADRPVTGLPLVRRDTGDAVVYELAP